MESNTVNMKCETKGYVEVKSAGKIEVEMLKSWQNEQFISFNNRALKRP